MTTGIFIKQPSTAASLRKLLVGGLVTIAAGSLVAEENKSSEKGLALEEIVVTAERRQASVQDVPITMQAFSGDSLQARGITDVTALQGAVPGFVMSGIVGFSQPYLRGVGTDIVGTGSDNSIAVYVDGAYISQKAVANVPFMDVERVEVLKGPQGTLYGRNASGGAIKIETLAPSFDSNIKADVRYGNYDNLRFRGMATGTLIEDKLAGRIALLYNKRDGFTDNSTGRALAATEPPVQAAPDVPSDYDDEDVVALRGQLLWTLNDDLRVRFIADYMERDTNNVVTKPLEQNGFLGGAFADQVTIPNDVFEGSTVESTFLELEDSGITVIASYDADNFKLSATTSYREQESARCWDSDGTNIRFLVTCFDLDMQQFAQEINLSFSSDRVEWINGIYYFYEDGPEAISLTGSRVDYPFFANILGIGAARLNINQDTETEAYGIFSHLTYSLTEKLDVSLGLRYSDEKRTQKLDQDVEIPLLSLMIPLGNTKQSESWDAITPKFSLSYALREDMMAYLTLSKGFKSGGFNIAQFQSAFDPEKIWAYEVGLKSEWMDHRLRANLSAFYYDFSGLQDVVFAQGLQSVSNATDADIYGLELSLSMQLTERLFASFDIAHLDSEYGSYSTFNTFTQAVENAEGNPLKRAPEWALNWQLHYSLPIQDRGTIELVVDGSWKDDIHMTPFSGDALTTQDAYSLVNGQLRFTTESGKWHASIWAKNLLDEEYYADVVRFDATGFSAAALFAAPRTFGIEFGVDY